MRVHLIQLLCPQRHCIFAGAYEDDKDTYEGTVAAMEEIKGGSPAWCGLCHASAATWKYEDRVLACATLAEAMPALRASGQDQIITAIKHGEILGPRHGPN